MADIEKRLNRAAVKKAATWGTEINVNAAGMGVTPLNPAVPKLTIPMVEDEAFGAFESDLTVANLNPSDFSLDFDYRFDGLENVLLAMLMGEAAAPAVQDALAYLHALTLGDSVSGIFGTYAVEKGTKVHTVPSFKVMKATFGLNNGLLKASFNLRGNKCIDNSGVITGPLTTATIPASRHIRAKFGATVFQMNGQGDADFAAPGDVIKPKNFTLEIERKFDAEHTSGSFTIIEPRENDKPSVKLTLEFPRMDATNEPYFLAWSAATEKKADIVCTGPIIEAAHAYYLKFQFPRLVIEDVEYADSKIIPAKIVMRGLTPDSAPSGMTGVLDPVVAQIMNTRSTGLLA